MFNPQMYRAETLRLIEQRHWTVEQMAEALELPVGNARKVLRSLHDSQLITWYKTEQAYGLPGGHAERWRPPYLR